MIEKKPIQHRMTRRAAAHDYARPGIYHITMHVADCLGQPLSAVVGDSSVPYGNDDAPRTVLTPVGQMVEYELLHSISAYYPMMEVQDYVIMPEHIHFIIEAHSTIVTQRGKSATLGQVIAGFKKGCNKRYWAVTGDAGGQTTAHTVPSSLPAGHKVPSNATTGRQPLFSEGYCDVMPLQRGQLATQRAYIKDNPRSRLLRSSNRASLMTYRGGIDTALTTAALRGYLQRECSPSMVTDEVLAAIQCRLLCAGGTIACDSYGNRALLTERRCLPVICHRRDAKRFAQQKERCLKEAAHGTVLVSACISPSEREIINESVHHGFPVIIIHDNGFPDRYHPSADRLNLCAADRLLIVSPWQYQYRGKNEQVTVPFCKTMNCVAQALCRTKDSWWKTEQK